MAETLFAYIIILLSCVGATYVFSSKISTQRASYYKKYIIPILIYTLFWGLRYDVGSDYLAYKAFYVGEVPENIEPGFRWLLCILNSCGFNYVSLFIVTSLLSVLSVYAVSKYEDRKFASYAIFFFYATSIVFFSQNGIRQAMALSIFWILVSRINKYSLDKLVLLAILSYLFHKSALLPIAIVLILYLIPIVKINKYVLIACLLFNTFIGVSLFNKVAEQMESIFEFMDYSRQIEHLANYENRAELGSGLGLILKLIINIVIIYNQDLFISNKHKTVPYFFYMTFVIGVLMEPIVSSNFLAKRMNLYFYDSMFFVCAYFCTMLSKERNSLNYVLRSFVVIGYFMLFIAAILSNSNECVPYKMVLYENL